MDAGVIRNFKHFHRKDLVRKKLWCVDHIVEFIFTLFDAILNIEKSWEKVSDDTIKSCCKHVGFQNPDEFVVEFRSMTCQMRHWCKCFRKKIFEILDVDAELATNEDPQTFHIVQMEETEEDDETDVTSLETVIHTVAEAHHAAQTSLHFAENQDNGAQMLPHINQVFQFIENHKTDTLKQAFQNIS